MTDEPLIPEDAELIDSLDASLKKSIDEDRPLDALRTIRAIGDVVSVRAQEAAAAAAQGAASWTDIGAALGISKQAAHQRLSRANEHLAKLDAWEKNGHAKIDTKFAEARAHLSRHPKLANDPKNAQRVEEKLSKAEQAKHEKLTRKSAAARKKLQQHTDSES